MQQLQREATQSISISTFTFIPLSANLYGIVLIALFHPLSSFPFLLDQ